MTRDRRSERVPPQSHEKLDFISFFSIVLYFFLKRHKIHISCLFIIDEICKPPFTTAPPFTAKSPFTANKENRLSRHSKQTCLFSLKYVCNGKLGKS